MPAPKNLALYLLTLAAFATFVAAQQPAPPARSGPEKIYLDVVVAPKSGKDLKPVAGLQRQDFTVLDNNAPQQITSFEALGPQAPVQVLMVVDAVNTTITNMAYEREQIDIFLRSNGGHLAHPIQLAIFNDTGTQIQQAATSDGTQLSASLDKSTTGLREINRSTQFEYQDRLNLSLRTLQSLIAKEGQLPGRKLIFWISPGWPLLSGPQVDLDARQQQQIYSQIVTLSTSLRRNNITLYSIDPLGSGQSVQQEFYYENFVNGIKKPGQAELADLSLQVLAQQSGGLVLHATNDIATHIQQAMDDTSAYYRIAYDAPPTEQTDEYHRIDIKLATPGLIARTRTGYYANPLPAAH
jgi:VWFA-related protein